MNFVVAIGVVVLWVVVFHLVITRPRTTIFTMQTQTKVFNDGFVARTYTPAPDGRVYLSPSGSEQGFPVATEDYSRVGGGDDDGLVLSPVSTAAAPTMTP